MYRLASEGIQLPIDDAHCMRPKRQTVRSKAIAIEQASNEPPASEPNGTRT